MQRLYFLLALILLGCANKAQERTSTILPGAYQTEVYLPLLEGKKVGLTVNHSSLIGSTHLTDSLLKHGIQITKVFTPEHGFTGTISD